MAATTSPLQMPAIPPPPGETSNLEDPTNDLHTIVIVTLVICLVPPTLLIPLRIFVRTRILKAFELVDVICLLAFAFFVGLVSLSFSLLDYGEGYHGWDITLATFSGYLHQANFTEIVYMPAILFTKLTILLQLLQVFVVGKRNFRYFFLHTLIWLNTLFFATLLFLEIFQCWPRVKIWDATAPGHCINISVTFVATAAINVASDLSILTLPVFWVSKLNMPWRKKVGVVLIFGTGVFACISSIMRVIVSVQDINSPDVTYTLAPVNLWSVAEISSGLILACLPFLPRLISSTKESLSAKYDHSGSHEGTVFTTHLQTHPSKREYFEMDDIALTSDKPTIPERALVEPSLGTADVESQSSLTRLKGADMSRGPEDVPSKDHIRGVEAEGGLPPEIRKTVEIRQHSSAGA